MKVKKIGIILSYPMTRLDYCQFLLVSQVNYTLTYFVDHAPTFSHDSIKRYLRRERMTPRLMWDNVRDEIVTTVTGYLFFDDAVLDKDFCQQIAHATGRTMYQLKQGLLDDCLCQ